MERRETHCAERRRSALRLLRPTGYSVHPIRNSPALGSDRCSISLTLCFNSSKTAIELTRSAGGECGPLLLITGFLMALLPSHVQLVLT